MFMHFSPADLLSKLLEAKPRPTAEAPRNARGLYGLVDHLGRLRYIGSTSSIEQNLYDRIHKRHRTGSEGMSHYFSQMYNTGRMWRDREEQRASSDAKLAKMLRNEFVADHCSAVWITLPDSVDISGLEAEVLAIAPDHAIAWNRRKMANYEEPVELVDATFRRLGWGAKEMAALERQRERFLKSDTQAAGLMVQEAHPRIKPAFETFPKGAFRFFALDVETANNDRGTICQIGVACVREDNAIETWATYVDPQVDHWHFTALHGISADTVRGAPKFPDVLDLLRDQLSGATVYQHSGFDRSAIEAACQSSNLISPNWNWQDSVLVARKAWPELRGDGGHGLANLKRHLGLVFDHHDAGEDARAAAEVVLRAEGIKPAKTQVEVRSDQTLPDRAEERVRANFNLGMAPNIECEPAAIRIGGQPMTLSHRSRIIGSIEIKRAQIKNHYISLTTVIEMFPADAIGGSNQASAAHREIEVDWGDGNPVSTDIDGSKKFFRKRGWIREFFEQNAATPGDLVLIEEIGRYRYRMSLQRQHPQA